MKTSDTRTTNLTVSVSLTRSEAEEFLYHFKLQMMLGNISAESIFHVAPMKLAQAILADPQFQTWEKESEKKQRKKKR